MIRTKRAVTLLLALLLLALSVSASADKKGKKEDFTDREITTEVIETVPDTIQEILDLAYEQLIEVDGKNLGEKNKFTAWRNNGKWGWCGGFITWCMLEKGIPQKEKNYIGEDEEVEGFVHVKEGGVGKIYTGYGRMNRITRVPQKGFIAVIGNVGYSGTTPFCHVGLVYDVQKLDEGKYRITTIEGNVPFYGDKEHKRAIHTVRMYIRDYDMNADVRENMTFVPEEERDREESPLFSYDQSYRSTAAKKRKMYFYRFLMPWIPEEDAAE